MSIWIIPLVIFAAVAALVLAVGTIMRERQENQVMEDRLEAMAGRKLSDDEIPSLLKEPIEGETTLFERFGSPIAKLDRLLDQSDVNLSVSILLLICVVLGLVGVFVCILLRVPLPIVPAGALIAIVPVLFLIWKRRKRLKKFGEQLPDALELMARALKAGHSLPSGLQLVSTEMPPPIATEFHRAYEEQNLGIPLEDALKSVGERVPNVDLGFFITAVLIQRQTGGDLAEILNKIGYIIRERFKIFGQVATMTAEGRLSGWTLIALPILVFLALLKLNPDYVMMLFDEPLGQKMLIVAVIMQIVGALVIKKIVNIRI